MEDKWYKESFALENSQNLLEKFHLYFDKQGKLKNSDTNNEYQSESLEEYNVMFSVIIKYIQELIINKYNFFQVFLPSKLIQNKEMLQELRPSIFISKNIKSAPLCLILIQGIGEVRAGIWARSTVTNQGLEEGSVIPFIEFIAQYNCSCIIMNPNLGVFQQGYTDDIFGHSLFVWKNYVMEKSNCQAKYFLVVAHSGGGHCFSKIFELFSDFVLKNVISLALTDTNFQYSSKKEKLKFVKKKAIHYVASNQPLGTIIKNNQEKELI